MIKEYFYISTHLVERVSEIPLRDEVHLLTMWKVKYQLAELSMLFISFFTTRLLLTITSLASDVIGVKTVNNFVDVNNNKRKINMCLFLNNTLVSLQLLELRHLEKRRRNDLIPSSQNRKKEHEKKKKKKDICCSRLAEDGKVYSPSEKL